MKKTFVKVVAMTAVAVSLSGCVGSMAVTGKLMQFNVEVVDNRYARAGVNFLLSPVYAITTAADYIVFNSLEFWTGKNPINGSPHIFDSKTETMLNINDDLDDSLKTAPVAPITLQRTYETGEFQQIDENTIQMDITYSNGDKATLLGLKNDNQVSYFIDGVLVAETTIEQLQELAASKA
ncbi:MULTISPECIES: DUF3332 domain-containing protein [Aliivibrio]|uniref:DUF3332 domain-containing protein n=1 Tax=Aliivibrio sifiae TaxID=566293 RepID=A0A2S7XEX7_9GAMM|nr:DUF3332 domain-containing protein [Aliivibrio sifiae]PQJ89910.1 hypothetical protein BTO22_10085 [Aliivibrio sifiae]